MTYRKNKLAINSWLKRYIETQIEMSILIPSMGNTEAPGLTLGNSARELETSSWLTGATAGWREAQGMHLRLCPGQRCLWKHSSTPRQQAC